MSGPAPGVLATISTVLYYACWPLIKFLQGVAFVLSPFLRIAQFVFLPITYVIHGIISILLLPLRLRLLERVETIYIYLGIAGLIGCSAGFMLFIISNVLSSSLRIDGSAEKDPPAKGRTVKSYRQARMREKGFTEPVLTSTAVKEEARERKRKQRGLLTETIIEEEDSDF
ncbi:hypothetical protein K491DRAFT_689677 [Lophiostoma macrostomum CBS 122681]|uniref:Uncharacterized protein n=1 Tax=Lophiostoma macrostomum CBS 122681 TaxID=1314788 RepID=A0A6A6TI13_9PLEO|nr:hypothetical protein K491DRAFT_689677 [Lophiostoma macrostomum CBS 122681]